MLLPLQVGNCLVNEAVGGGFVLNEDSGNTSVTLPLKQFRAQDETRTNPGLPPRSGKIAARKRWHICVLFHEWEHSARARERQMKSAACPGFGRVVRGS